MVIFMWKIPLYQENQFQRSKPPCRPCIHQWPSHCKGKLLMMGSQPEIHFESCSKIIFLFNEIYLATPFNFNFTSIKICLPIKNLSIRIIIQILCNVYPNEICETSRKKELEATDNFQSLVIIGLKDLCNLLLRERNN